MLNSLSFEGLILLGLRKSDTLIAHIVDVAEFTDERIAKNPWWPQTDATLSEDRQEASPISCRNNEVSRFDFIVFIADCEF